MKELLTVAFNFAAAWTEDGKMIPWVEVVVVTSEPVYSVDGAGDVVRNRETSQFRFLADPQGLRKIAEGMVKVSEEAEALVAKEAK